MSFTPLARSYAGSATAGSLSAIMNNSTTSFSSSTPLGWVDVTGGSFSGYVVVEVEPGTANAEKILCTYNSTTGQLTISQRNYDGGSFPVSSSTHASDSTFILVATATEFAETNAAVQALSTVLAGTNSSTTPGNVGVDISPNPGASRVAVGVDHTHNISSSSLNTWLGTATVTGTNLSIPAANLTSGALPSGVTVPYASLTGAPVAPAAATAAASTTSTISLSSGTTPLLSTNANPTGSFTNYTWHAMCKQQSSITAPSDFAFVILQRLVGGSTWTAVANVNVGTAAASLQYQNIAASGAWSSSGATDSEFQIGIVNTANTYTWTASNVRLTVIGLS